MNTTLMGAAAALALLTAGPAALVPGSATAGSPRGDGAVSPPVRVVGHTMYYTAAKGVANNVNISQDAAGRIALGDVNLIDQGDCGKKIDYSVSCGGKITRVVVRLRDRRDSVYSSAPWYAPPVAFTAYGGSGDDSLEGNQGYGDRLYGGPGDDWVTGEATHKMYDESSYAFGDDLLVGGPGNDHLRGRRGADTLLGGGGADIAKGGPGADRIAGGPGHDTLSGQQGRDRLFSADGVTDTLFGGLGHDSARIDVHDVLQGIEHLR